MGDLAGEKNDNRASPTDALARLQQWYLRHADGEWEHYFGLKIESLETPGWLVDIELTETDLEGAPFQQIGIQRSETDWILCRIHPEAPIFEGRGGPHNLCEIIEIFLTWDASFEGDEECDASSDSPNR